MVGLHAQRSAPSAAARLACWTMMGAGSALAVLVRPVYLLAAILLVVLALLSAARAPGAARFLYLGVLVCSVCCVCLPQVLINHHHAGSLSPLPRTEVATVHGDLYLKQLGWGVTMQRYETVVGAAAGGRPFIDPVGTRLFQQEGRAGFASLGDYAAFALRHPLDVIAIYVRHLFNGCDLWYSTPYLDDVRDVRADTILVNLAVWLLTLLQCRRFFSLERVRGSLPYALILIIPVITAIPSAVEVRFFWPLHLLANALALYGFASAREAFGAVRRHWLFLTVCALIWVTLSRYTYASLPT
jgi:hypothetical protein